MVTNSSDEWERTFNICWGGVYNCTRAFLPMLQNAEESHIVNTSSINGFWASVGPRIPHTAYSAAKFAVKGFTPADPACRASDADESAAKHGEPTADRRLLGEIAANCGAVGPDAALVSHPQRSPQALSEGPSTRPAAAPCPGLNSRHGCEQPQNPAGDPKLTAGFRFNRREVRLSDIGEHLDASRRGRIKRSAPLSSVSAATFKVIEFSVPVFASVVVIAAGEFDEDARLIAHRPRIVTRWQQHDLVL
jgi:hypothetical protein